MIHRDYSHNAQGTYLVRESCSVCGKFIRKRKVSKRAKVIIFQPSNCSKCDEQLSDFTYVY